MLTELEKLKSYEGQTLLSILIKFNVKHLLLVDFCTNFYANVLKISRTIECLKLQEPI